MPTPRDLIESAADAFTRAGLYFGHGTDNARDEAACIVLHALDLPSTPDESDLARPLNAGEFEVAERLIEARIETRRPAAYLTNKAGFAGHEFYVDERVIVPRSPLAELIGERFQPWLGSKSVGRVLDIGTGSGCIALAVAMEFPAAEVVATDVSQDALEVAAMNCDQHGLGDRVTFLCADLFPPAAHGFDLIVSNPPYVPHRVFDTLPREYLHEPRIALAAGDDGCVCVERILLGAAEHLSEGGLLIVEVGEIWQDVEIRFPRVAFTWIELKDGGEGVFVVQKDQLESRLDPKAALE